MWPMSALGQKRNQGQLNECPLYPRKRTLELTRGMLCAKSRHYDVGYSMISSASAERFGGISMPSALAVLRLMTSSNLLD